MFSFHDIRLLFARSDYGFLNKFYFLMIKFDNYCITDKLNHFPKIRNKKMMKLRNYQPAIIMRRATILSELKAKGERVPRSAVIARQQEGQSVSHGHLVQ
jgi:hypothetical protein